VAPFAGAVGAGPLCRIATGIKADGSPDYHDAASATASVDSGVVALRCLDATGAELFSSSIDCFTVSGDYTVGAGAIRIEGLSSDRTCRVSLTVLSDRVNGLIGCDRDPPPALFSPIFAYTLPPIGLGSFSIPR
jgi:hypothetical protein